MSSKAPFTFNQTWYKWFTNRIWNMEMTDFSFGPLILLLYQQRNCGAFILQTTNKQTKSNRYPIIFTIEFVLKIYFWLFVVAVVTSPSSFLFPFLLWVGGTFTWNILNFLQCLLWYKIILNLSIKIHVKKRLCFSFSFLFVFLNSWDRVVFLFLYT